jgi:hypothetical protein
MRRDSRTQNKPPLPALLAPVPHDEAKTSPRRRGIRNARNPEVHLQFVAAPAAGKIRQPLSHSSRAPSLDSNSSNSAFLRTRTLQLRWEYDVNSLFHPGLQLAHPPTDNLHYRIAHHTALPARRAVSAPLRPIGWVVTILCAAPGLAIFSVTARRWRFLRLRSGGAGSQGK